MVLIIENDCAQALLVRLALERHGTLPDGTSLACAIAANGAEVAAILASTTPTTIAVVILDRDLDRLNGLSLIPLLRQSPALRPDAIIIVYSADDEATVVEEARRCGADAAVSKNGFAPVADGLLEAIRLIWTADERQEPRTMIEVRRTGVVRTMARGV